MQQITFPKGLNELAARSYRIAREHGFHEGPIDVNEKLVLSIGELVEAQNELRSGHLVDELYYGENGKPEGFVVELADAVIRILDLAYALNLDIENAVDEKSRYNEGRPFRHGKQF